VVFKNKQKKHHIRPKPPNATQAPTKQALRQNRVNQLSQEYVSIFKVTFTSPGSYHQNTSTRINARRDSPNPKLLAPEGIAHIPLEARVSRSSSLSHHIKAY